MLMAVTDHPVNLALLLKNLGYAKSNWWPKLCKASGVIFIICKLVAAGLAISVMINVKNGSDASWQVINHSFSEWLDTDNGFGLTTVNIVLGITIGGFLVVQVYIGYVLWVLGKKY